MPSHILNPRLLIHDVLVAAFSFFAAYYLRHIFGGGIQPFIFYTPFAAFSVLTFSLAFSVYRLYDSDRPSVSILYFADLLRALFLWSGVLTAFAFFTKTDYSRAVVAMFFTLSATATYLMRIFAVMRSPQHEDEKLLQDITRIAVICRDTPDGKLIELFSSYRNGFVLREAIRRFMDILLSATLLIFILPMLAVLTFMIRRDTPGPGFLAQERVGKRGKKFMLYKLRTMKAGTELYAPAPRDSGDPRVTRVGRFLRVYSFDELPQLWNVLRGEMSMVGPRPEMPFIVEKYKPWQSVRLTVKPGITGLWQILGRKDIPLEENIEYDIYYILNQSLVLDLAILLKTFPHLILPRGAY